jgi:hypothetical protein
MTEKPKDSDRPLSVEDTSITRNTKVRGGIEVLHINSGDDSCNPYERQPEGRRNDGVNTTRRDLRKLSEHIKMMRELEERKKREGNEED